MRRHNRGGENIRIQPPRVIAIHDAQEFVDDDGLVQAPIKEPEVPFPT